MIYKGWTLLAVLSMPRAYYINNTGSQGHYDIKYGKEIEFSNKPRPNDHIPYKYMANKDNGWIESRTLTGLKELIDNKQKETKNVRKHKRHNGKS